MTAQLLACRLVQVPARFTLAAPKRQTGSFPTRRRDHPGLMADGHVEIGAPAVGARWAVLAAVAGKPMACVRSGRRSGQDRGDAPRALVEAVPAGAVLVFATKDLENSGG